MSKLINKKLKTIEVIFKGVANKQRILILFYLSDRKERDAGEIADFLQRDYKSIFPHLERLLKAGLIQKRREGILVLYQITDLGQKMRRFILNLLKIC